MHAAAAAGGGHACMPFGATAARGRLPERAWDRHGTQPQCRRAGADSKKGTDGLPRRRAEP